MKAKYMIPDTSTKTPPMASMRARFFWWTSIDSRNSSTKNAQGLKASSPAISAVISGSE